MHTSTTLLSSPPPCRPVTLTLTPLKTRPSRHPPLLRGMLLLQGSEGKLLIRRDVTLISQSQGKLNYMRVSVLTVSMHRPEVDPFDAFVAAARWIPLAIDPFLSLQDVILVGIEGRSGRREKMNR